MPEPLDQSLPVVRCIDLVTHHRLTYQLPVNGYRGKDLIAVRVEQGTLNASN